MIITDVDRGIQDKGLAQALAPPVPRNGSDATSSSNASAAEGTEVALALVIGDAAALLELLGLERTARNEIVATIQRDSGAFAAGLGSGLQLGITEVVVETVTFYRELGGSIWDTVKGILTGDEVTIHNIVRSTLLLALSFSSQRPEQLRAAAAKALGSAAEQMKNRPTIASLSLELGIVMEQAAQAKEIGESLVMLSPQQVWAFIKRVAMAIASVLKETVRGLMESLTMVRRSAKALGEQFGWWIGGLVASLLLSYVGA